MKIKMSVYMCQCVYTGVFTVYTLILKASLAEKTGRLSTYL